MTEQTEFLVELPVYAGPFRLLAELVLDHRMDVCDVPVARVTEAFIAQGAARMDGWSLEEATWFLAVCAVMLELKVGRLMPRPGPDTEEDLLDGASPDLVYARSLELAAFRQLSGVLAERMAAAALMVPRVAGPPTEFSHLYPDVMQQVTPQSLAAVAAAALAPPPDLDLSHVTPIRVSLADALQALQDRMVVRREASFRDLVEECRERIEVVVRFLALLELYREGKVELSQAAVFGNIEVRWQPSTRGGASVDVDDGPSVASPEDEPQADIPHRRGEERTSGSPAAPPRSTESYRGGDVE